MDLPIREKLDTRRFTDALALAGVIYLSIVLLRLTSTLFYFENVVDFGVMAYAALISGWHLSGKR